MDNPGILMFANSAGEDFTVSEAGTQIGEVIEDLEGLRSLALQARLAVGTAGTSVKAYIQTSLDQGATWFDIACFAFTTLTATRLMNLSADAALGITTPTDGALADNTKLDGPIGDRLRPKVVTVGTFSGPTTLALRGNAR